MKLHNNIKPIVVTILAIGFFLLVKWQFPVYKVNGNTMLGDYKDGEYLVVSKFHEIKLGDVVVYDYKEKIRLSRVVGLEGDQVQGIDGELMVNDHVLYFGAERYGYSVYCDTTVKLIDMVGYQELYPKREYFALLSKDEQSKVEQIEGVLKVVKQIHPSKGISANRLNQWSKDNFGPFVVPSNSEVFVVNDNRTNSLDSRTFGTIHKDNVVGKVLLKL